MLKLFFIIAAFLPAVALSTPLRCQINLNLSPLFSGQVESQTGQKVLVAHTATIDAYVTEKENHFFIIEAFLADYEARIYGEGFIKVLGDQISASIWGRENQIEISCVQANKL